MSATWEPGLGDHLRTIWRYRYLVLATAFAVAACVFAYRSTAANRYEAEASIRITVLSSEGLALDGSRAEYASRIYAELAESPTLIERAVENGGLALTEDQASKLLDVEWATPPGFVDVQAAGPSPEAAADLANGMAAALIEAVEVDDADFSPPTSGPEESSNDDGRRHLTATAVELAEAPLDPSSPRPVRDAVVAFLLALFILAEGAVLWRPARGLLPLARTAERVTDLVGVPSLDLTGDAEDRTRLALFAARHLSDKRAMLVVHCTGHPWPAAAVRLAEAVAAVGRRSLVVDGDSFGPVLHERLGLPRRPGLVEVLAGDRALADSVFASAATPNVWLLTSGGDEADSGPQPIDRPRPLDHLEVDDRFDFVVVSLSSTVVPDGLAGAVAELRGSTILVVDPERTRRRELSEFVHGFGGQDDVAAVLLMSDAAASAETDRLAARWHRKRTTENGATPEPTTDRRRPLSGRTSTST